jgi:transcriptional regulator GlxA family with amidase domain
MILDGLGKTEHVENAREESMKRRKFLKNTSSMAVAVMASGISQPDNTGWQERSPRSNNSGLTPPAAGNIPVAFAISEGATMIDFAGPWEVFQDVMLMEGGMRHPFSLFTVADKTDPIKASGGMRIIPDYTFETAPAPKIIVVPAQRGSAALHEWLRKVHGDTDVTMSVCTGAFHLARAGLLAGQSATTHHDFLDRFEKQFPDIKVKRGLRFIEGEKISTAGGLTSGIDLALRVVERYFGRKIAEQTAIYMEYQGKGWIV